ncbi:thiol reductant ABC exporter subunit CydD [Paeniglutamicibacter antarcticus]|uniref:Thiol reductant ABC exporter subunit CydD n=1 Tax=Arthrobacter terrae TaxID=2935737 RepID=A0A931GCE3_9MICC|nr:thiol reductant ABC exporter subunit CydD [Arthrobacter terrae]
MPKRPPLPTGSQRTLYLLGLLSALKALTWVVLAQAVVSGITALISSHDSLTGALLLGTAAALARAAAVWGIAVVARRTAAGAKEDLRLKLTARMVQDAGSGAGGQGSGTVLATRGLDALDNYYTQFLPALLACATVPLLIGARVLLADWVSAVIVVLTVPLVPLFMVLIGMHTQEQVERAAGALSRLSNHLVELAKGLPVLVGLGRARAQTEALRKVADDYRRTTMGTLRVAFLSALALELIATLSVAVVAVFIGLRLVQGSMDLQTGLLVLILVPECYLPLRELGTAHHASEDGREALARAEKILTSPAAAPLAGRVIESAWRTERNDGGAPADCAAQDRAPEVSAAGLHVGYPDRSTEAVSALTFTAPAGKITALSGPSGCGKSTVVHVLAGIVAPLVDEAAATSVTSSAVRVSGSITGIDPDRLAWVPQHPATVAQTARAEVELYGASGTTRTGTTRTGTTRNSGTTSSGAEPSGAADMLLARVGLTYAALRHPAELSPGELRRLALARALARIDAGATVLLLDEPTAHLDARTARRIERTIRDLRGSITIIVVAHNKSTLALADHVVQLDACGVRTNVAADADDADADDADDADADAAVAADVAADTDAAVDVTAAGAATGPDAASGSRRAGTARLLKLLVSVLEPWRPRFLLAVVAGAVATLAALALTALSGWLIVRASQQPAILYLLVAIVGVRFFGLLRALSRYCERLWLHDAVFAALTRLRVRVWESLALRVLSRRSLLRGDGAVDHLIGDFDAVRDLAPRVVLPPAAGLLAAAAVATTTSLLLPAAVALQLVVLAGTLLLAPAIALWADNRAGIAEHRHRSAVIRIVSGLLGAAADLRVNRAEGPLLERLRLDDLEATAAVQRAARAQGTAQGLLVLLSALGAFGMLAVGAGQVASGTLPVEALAALVLLNLSLVDAFAPVSAAVQLWPALRTVLARFSDDFAPGSEPVAAPVPAPARRENAHSALSLPHPLPAQPVDSRQGSGMAGLTLKGVTARWPDSAASVFSGLDATVRRGEWLTVTGESGSGKSTLLAVMLGFLAPVAGDFTSRGRIAWCPQQGHLFDSSLRANLLLARARDNAPTEAELVKVLDDVGLGPLLRELPRGLDTRLGPEGSRLSGGQRQRVAVARTLLTGADILLLDEPTAHLDNESAALLMADLRRALRDKAVVLVTHDPAAGDPEDLRLELDGRERGGDGIGAAVASAKACNALVGV